jgi:hypothetical protein
MGSDDVRIGRTDHRLLRLRVAMALTNTSRCENSSLSLCGRASATQLVRERKDRLGEGE